MREEANSSAYRERSAPAENRAGNPPLRGVRGEGTLFIFETPRASPSPHPTMTRRDRVKAAAPSGAGPRVQMAPLQGGLRLAVHALAAGLELLSSDWPDEAAVDWPVYDGGVRLARHVVDAAVGAPDAPGDGALAHAARAHYVHVAELRRDRGMQPVPLDAYDPPKDVLGLVSAALREQALEHHTAETMVATDRDGGRLLATMPVSVEQAHVWLSGALYEKVEAWVEDDPLIYLERAASAWWLSRWRGARPLAGDDFAQGVREQEFSLVERPLRCLGVSAMEHLVEEKLLRGIGPRQQRMAAHLLQSQAGVWTVKAREDGRAVLLAAWDGTPYEVREHATPQDNSYGPGYVALGRLIPFGDGTWLRSPGMFMMSFGARSTALARDLARGMAAQAEHMPVEAVLEAAAYTLAGVRGLPRAVPPAPTPDDAASLGRELTALLREAGIARPADPGSAAAIRLSGGMEGEVLEYDLDLVLGEYLNAVFQQSQKSRAVREARRRRDRRARKKGKRRR